MTAILSLIVSLAMLFSGVGSLPAVPETANQYTLRNLTLTINDEAVTLDPELQLTTALGAEQLGLDFEIHAGDNTLLPISGRLDTNGVAFSFADNGKAYTLSYATLGELLGLTEDSDAQVAEVLATATKLATSLSAYNEAVKDPAVREQLDALNQQQINKWVEISGAEFAPMDVDVNGSTFPGQHAVLNMGCMDAYASMDDYLSSDIEPLRDYTQSLLKLLNMIAGSDCASFTELIEAMVDEDEIDSLNAKLPLDMTIAEQDGTKYVRVALDTEVEGVALNVEEIMISDGSNIDMVMIVNASDDESTDIEMSLNLFADEQNLSAVFDIVGDVKDSYETIDADGSQTTVETSAKVSVAVSDYVLIDENGLAESFFNFGVDLVESDSQSVEENTATISFGTQSAESREEDGSITADNTITLNVDDNGDALTAELAFQTNSAAIPYVDSFAGKEMLELTSDAESEAYQQIQTDLYALLGDVMTLAADDSVVELMNSFAAVESSLENIDSDVEVIGGYDYDDYDDDFDYDLDMDDVNPATLEEAEVIYGSPIPAYTAPEGYALDYIYADEGYLSVDYAAEDTYFSMTITPAYEDENGSALYMLGEDGALGEPGGMLVQLTLNEDGSVAYADVMAGNSDITIFFDDVDLATAEAILAGLAK